MRHLRDIVMAGMMTLAFVTGAVAQPIAPADWSQPISAHVLPAGKVRAGAIYYYMAYDGRELEQFQGVVEGGVANRLALGAVYRTNSGHGRSKSNTYTSDGWSAWGKYEVLTGYGEMPSLALFGEYTHDDATLHIESSTLKAFADPPTTSTGVQLVASGYCRRAHWHVSAGAYRTEVLRDELSSTYLAGAGILAPVDANLDVLAAATGFYDDYADGSNTVELRGALSYAYAERGTVTLSASYFPSGIPLAGTPFSPAAAVGTFYGGSATESMRTDAMGYLALAGDYAF